MKKGQFTYSTTLRGGLLSRPYSGTEWHSVLQSRSAGGWKRHPKIGDGKATTDASDPIQIGFLKLLKGEVLIHMGDISSGDLSHQLTVEPLTAKAGQDTQVDRWLRGLYPSSCSACHLMSHSLKRMESFIRGVFSGGGIGATVLLQSLIRHQYRRNGFVWRVEHLMPTNYTNYSLHTTGGRTVSG